MYRLSWPSFFEHLIWVPIRLFLWIFGRLEIRGLEHVRGVKGNAIVASNHVNELDPLIIVSCLPFSSPLLPLIYVVKESRYYRTNWRGIKKFLYGGFFFRIIGGYAAYSGYRDYEKALANHLAAMEQGLSVCIFPVGRIHDVDQYPARGGVAYLAAKTSRPIIPVRIDGINRRTSFMTYLTQRPRVIVTFGAPLYAADIFEVTPTKDMRRQEKRCEAAAEKVMQHIMALR